MKKQGKMMMHIQPKQKTNNVYQLYIYDDVKAKGPFDWSTWTYLDSETSAAYFRDKLSEIPDNATIELYINSYGGSVKEGVSIYNQLVRHNARKVGYVDGYACSVAFLILMACDHIVMGLGTSALAHNMWMEVAGNAEELRKAADDLDKQMETNRKIFLKRCGKKMSEEELIKLMSEERFLTPDECLELGFCDEIAETIQNTGESNKDDNSGEDGDGSGGDDHNSDDEKEEKMKQYIALLINQQTQAIQEQMQKTNSASEPEENKCINFFNQFI